MRGFNSQKRRGLGYLLNILHPISHLVVAHVVDILDEGIVFLPEGHPEAGLKPILKYSLGLNTFLMSCCSDTYFVSLILSLTKAWIHCNVVTASSWLHRWSLHWFTGAVKNFHKNNFSCFSSLYRANMLVLERARSRPIGSESYSSAGVTMVAL